ncbi:MAG: tRNA (adenosine(37)-N6)-threonylcarbamoyltransferase complex ATPase subunit type 1 TsaE [Planctomycetes bacterium]|nr:tRNA (adenosine(37)-N6)-threonylcarbamoyltransferase complex ATPase subunit type 1 TsaE [Planctomycetota bacterium]
MSSVVLHLPPDPAATERLGEWIGERLRPGDVVGLLGELGAGKTTLVRGIGRGLSVEDPDAVSSPTYLLVIEHAGPTRLVHADAYLPAKLAGFLADGGLDYLFDPGAVVVVEWANRIRAEMPARVLWVELVMAADRGRTVSFAASGSPGFPWLADLPKMGKSG